MSEKFKKISNLIKSGINSKIENTNYTEWAYAIGYVAIMVLDIIVSIFFPLLFASKMGKLGKTGKVILKFVNIMNGIIEKAIGIALKPVAFTAKYIFKAIDKIFTAIAKGAKFINKIIDEIALQLEKIILKSFANIKIEFFIFVKGKVRRLNGTFLPIESIFKIIGKQISKKIENKFNNLGIIFVEDSQQGIYHILDAETKATLKTGNKKQIKNWIEKVDKKNPDDAKKFVDDLKEKASKDIENSKLSAAEKLTLAKKLWKEYKYKDFMEKPPKKPCFLAGTLIHTTSGLKPIEEIKTGDQVWCFDEIKQELAQQKVSETFSNFAEKYAKITTQSGEEFLVTGQHLFYQKNSKTWIKAYQLKVGMHLYNAKNNSLDKITKTQIINQKTTTYNFEVPTHHNYLVGNAGILTHNGPGYKTTTLRKYAFYRLTTIDITDTLETQYIGKTTRSLKIREIEHFNEGKRAFNKGIQDHKHWKFKDDPRAFNLNDGPLEYIEMTEFESAVVEKFHLENHRYKTGWELKNRQNPLSEKSFNKWKKFHSDRNPCLFFV